MFKSNTKIILEIVNTKETILLNFSQLTSLRVLKDHLKEYYGGDYLLDEIWFDYDSVRFELDCKQSLDSFRNFVIHNNPYLSMYGDNYVIFIKTINNTTMPIYNTEESLGENKFMEICQDNDDQNEMQSNDMDFNFINNDSFDPNEQYRTQQICVSSRKRNFGKRKKNTTSALNFKKSKMNQWKKKTVQLKIY
ncbi:hypothetical protein M0813_06043 [Anaeramoeba flamelloides]|uniref:PB1 domain-containing protein n=1 Tax=Anaeramoeba flamelloides TaxID=1746091 RepID=A0ABQ8XJ46_9EUKA|nr:hypothetical protein M0813_06043 [Anaeramoeba flamelloides]